MSYALFAQKKLTLYGLIESVRLQQTQRADEQRALATRTLTLQSQVTNIQSSQSAQLGLLYNDLADADDSVTRQSINDKINEQQSMFDAEVAVINNLIYQTSIKENAIEMEVKRLDTEVSALQKELDAIEEAEGDAIDKATPKFKGVA